MAKTRTRGVDSSRWITAAGYTPLWSAFAFPLAAYAGLLLALGGIWQGPGAVALLAAAVIGPAVALRVLRAWASGDLAVRTNAATA